MKLIFLSFIFICLGSLCSAQQPTELERVTQDITYLEQRIAVKHQRMGIDSTMQAPIGPMEMELQRLKMHRYNLEYPGTKGQASELTPFTPKIFIKRSEFTTFPENKQNVILSNPERYLIIENE